MKELSIEGKAKAYDKALERAIKLKEAPQSVFYEYSPNEGDTICDYIFPELKESEDEEIKKRIIALINAHGQGKYKEEMLAWTEKQYEQKPFNYENINIQQNDFAPKLALEAINEEKVDNANKVEPKQEKLTEFEKAVKQVMEEAIECGDTRNLKADAEMLLSLVHKSAWSEEDEQITLSIEQVMNCASLLNIVPEKLNKINKWLKSLKQRYTWKPSDEQIKALEHFVRSIGESGYASPYDNNTKLLYSILSDLKKLKA